MSRLNRGRGERVPVMAVALVSPVDMTVRAVSGGAVQVDAFEYLLALAGLDDVNDMPPSRVPLSQHEAARVLTVLMRKPMTPDPPKRQLGAVRGKGIPIRWHIAEEKTVAAIRRLFERSRVVGIEVVHTSKNSAETFMGWLMYFPRSRGTVPPLPAPVRIEPMEDKGMLVILTPDLLTVSNPEHVELAQRVHGLLDRAGLLKPIVKP